MKILHLEDNPRDAVLVRDVLAVDWPDCVIKLVATREDFIRELAVSGYDLIISDYRLPGFNGLEALELVRERAPEIPFIFFSGTLGEERAIEAVRAGAADYVIKDRMQRLPISVQRVMRENTEARARRRIEEALAQEQYLLRILMNHVPDHVYFKDVESRFMSVSRSLALRHGLEPPDLKGKTDFDVFSEEHASRARADEQRIMRTGEMILDQEEKETWPDGSVTWVSSTKLPLRDASGKIVGTFGVSRDITARKQAEDRIHEQAEILNHTPIAIVITDLEHRIIYCNEGAIGLYGVAREAAIGRTAGDIFTPETMERLAASRAAIEATGRWTGEVTVSTRSGRQLQAEFHMSLINDAGGRPKARLSIALDITEKKKLEAQFLRAQRLESLGMLAAGIAHDLNNILAPVLMGAPLLRLRATHPSDLRVLDGIENSAGRGASLVRQILSFAHGASGDKALIQPKHLLRDITGLIQQTFPKNIRLEDDIPNDLWTVQGNPTQLHQVLLNLCVNARDAMPRGGTLRLRAENRRMNAVTEGSAGQHAVAGAYLMLEVTDTGTGIFTTKAEGKGTGLGLATVRGIAANHGGFVRVDSTAGRGTVFQVYLPASEQVAAGPEAAASAPFLTRGRGELVLVVDDEGSIRDLVTAVLSRYGYRVLVAANGIEAMALYIPRATEIALVITDISMPEMGGGDLALALAQLNPAVKMLFMSGAGVTPGADDNIPPDALVLTKPFAVEKLVGAVREKLEAKPG
jgi:two-component system cell cycle sensor histidine kinase/response regulator CckA